ncbi:MAG: peptide-methionine (S)-S-oxide reductase MsrA [Gemmatimonadota bacterium]
MSLQMLNRLRRSRVPGAVAALALLPLLAASAAGAPTPDRSVPPVSSARADTAVFAGGCFWGIEAVFKHLEGVTSATSGYSGGTAASPSYEQVSSGRTGHAESVQVVYDPSKISYQKLLDVFFTVAHDPTELNRQGPDEGTQYRSALFVRTDAQRDAANAYIAKLRAAKTFAQPIVTEVTPFRAFYPAEEYHQNFLARHPTYPYIVYNDLPKLAALRKQFPALYREPAGA